MRLVDWQTNKSTRCAAAPNSTQHAVFVRNKTQRMKKNLPSKINKKPWYPRIATLSVFILMVYFSRFLACLHMCACFSWCHSANARILLKNFICSLLFVSVSVIYVCCLQLCFPANALHHPFHCINCNYSMFAWISVLCYRLWGQLHVFGFGTFKRSTKTPFCGK